MKLLEFIGWRKWNGELDWSEIFIDIGVCFVMGAVVYAAMVLKGVVC